jgi:hypothetical protein
MEGGRGAGGDDASKLTLPVRSAQKSMPGTGHATACMLLQGWCFCARLMREKGHAAAISIEFFTQRTKSCDKRRITDTNILEH